MKTFLTFIFLAVLGFASALPASASSVVLKPGATTVQAGQTFTLPITVDPAGTRSYTVGLFISFPPDFIEATSFKFGTNWLAVNQPSYDSFDNARGEIIKTAGFPKGFVMPQSFGTVTFRAKKAGQSPITIGAQSFVLDAKNKNTLTSRPQVAVTTIAGKATPKLPSTVEKKTEEKTEEKNLFDVSLTPEVQTSGAGLVSKVAPGEFLPFTVKLLNFGNTNEVDVTISYTIADQAGKMLYSSQETVAVQTTASFIKTIQIPFDTVPGRYIAQSSITYPDQVAPATTEFPFTVERKIIGLFQSQFILYGILALFLCLVVAIISYIWIRHRSATRLAPMDYSNIPHGERTFYEILSDTIAQMRQRVGDDALRIASEIDGLKIDTDSGRVLALSEPPSKVIAALVSEYEKLLGKKVSFSFRKEETGS